MHISHLFQRVLCYFSIDSKDPCVVVFSAKAFEIGASAVMVNTAIAAANDAVSMAKAFKLACEAGVMAYEAGLAGIVDTARATSPMEKFLEEAMA